MNRRQQRDQQRTRRFAPQPQRYREDYGQSWRGERGAVVGENQWGNQSPWASEEDGGYSWQSSGQPGVPYGRQQGGPYSRQYSDYEFGEDEYGEWEAARERGFERRRGQGQPFPAGGRGAPWNQQGGRPRWRDYPPGNFEQGSQRQGGYYFGGNAGQYPPSRAGAPWANTTPYGGREPGEQDYYDMEPRYGQQGGQGQQSGNYPGGYGQGASSRWRSQGGQGQYEYFLSH
jgi:hypothetical protein